MLKSIIPMSWKIFSKKKPEKDEMSILVLSDSSYNH